MKTDSSNRSEAAQPIRILALDGVRGIAVLGVIVAHGLSPIQTESPWADFLKALLSFGTYGVDLFFVLSGFLITGILLKNHGAGNLLKVFWIRRIARIMPLYVAFLVIMYSVCAFFIPENMPKVPGWAYFFYLQNFFLAGGAAPSSFGFDITWSLVIEEHFYLLFPFLIALSPPKVSFADHSCWLLHGSAHEAAGPSMAGEPLPSGPSEFSFSNRTARSTMRRRIACLCGLCRNSSPETAVFPCCCDCRMDAGRHALCAESEGASHHGDSGSADTRDADWERVSGLR
jgi:hypothetical protein